MPESQELWQLYISPTDTYGTLISPTDAALSHIQKYDVSPQQMVGLTDN